MEHLGKLDKFLNTDFRIVIEYDKNFKVRKEKRHLIGRRGLFELVGMVLYQKIILRAYKASSEKITIRLRRGASIIFYRK